MALMTYALLRTLSSWPISWDIWVSELLTAVQIALCSCPVRLAVHVLCL